MLKIVSDPTSYPLREVSLTDAAGAAAVFPVPSDAPRDLLFDRPDGGRNVILIPRAAGLELKLGWISYSTAEALLELAGRSKRNRARKPVQVFPNYDRFTRLSVPLVRSLKAWKYDTVNDVLTKVDASTYTRAVPAYYQDERGNVGQVASGLPRFMASALGNAVVMGAGYNNLCSPYHPSAGNLMWFAQAGAPTIAWTTDMNSAVLAKGGCVRISKATGSACAAGVNSTIDAGTGGELVYARVWLCGRGRCQMSFTIGATSLTMPDFTLDHQWRPYVVGPLAKTDAATTVAVSLSIYDDGFTRVAFAGPITVYKQTNADKQQVQEWDDNAANAADVLKYTVALGTTNLTFTACGLLPQVLCWTRLWRAPGAPSNLLVQWETGGLRFYFCGSSIEASLGGLVWPTLVGRPYHATARLTGNTANVAFAILQPDGTLYRIANSITFAAVQDFSSATEQAIGGDGTNRVGDATVQHVRLDNRRWTDAEVAVHEEMYLLDSWREVMLGVSGRTFVIRDLDIHPIEEASQLLTGRVYLEEISTDPDMGALV